MGRRGGDFRLSIQQILAERVGLHCSRCRCVTTGPHTRSDKRVNVGVAAHITAASPGGPRYDKRLTPDERRAIDNAIWLCQTCAKLVDSDDSRYTAGDLRRWKVAADHRHDLAVQGLSDAAEERRRLEAARLFLRHLRRLRDFAVVRLQNNVQRVREVAGSVTPSSMPPFGDWDRSEWYRLCDKWRDTCIALLKRHGLEQHLSTLGEVTVRADRGWPPKMQRYYNNTMERLDRLRAVMALVEKHAVWEPMAFLGRLPER